MRASIHRFLGNRAGTTAIEYALIAVVLSLTAIAGFTTIANSVQTTYNDQGKKLESTRTRNQ